jgi:CHAD domain-containing protein
VCRAQVSRDTVTVATLPEGPIRDRVLGLADIRELLPKASVDGPMTLLAVLDEQEKTVSRLVVHGPFAVDGAGTGVGVRVHVEEMRGYGKEAARVAAQLAAAPGLAPAESSLFAAASAARGIHPGRYRSKPDLKFRPARPAPAAFAATFAQLLEMVRDNVDGTLRQLDTEFLHDLRVAVRRSRSLAKVAQHVIDEPVRLHYSAELKWIGDATSLSRDLDVYLLGFDDLFPDADAADIAPFRVLLEEHCRKAHLALNRVLRSQRFKDLLAGWERDLARPSPPAGSTPQPIGDVSRALLSTTWTRVTKRGRTIDADSPAEAVHDLRKRCKELRYLLEFFASLYDPAVHRGVVDELKRLQDNLGEFQDAESQRLMVRSYAEELRTGAAPIGTLLTLGRLEYDLQVRQRTAHDDCAACWQRFDSKQNRKWFMDMVSST